jgi:hypothetical protein
VARIEGIQRSIQNGNRGRGLWWLEAKLQNELREILKKEELMWFHRSSGRNGLLMETVTHGIITLKLLLGEEGIIF